MLITDPDIPWLFITRNPYVRILSAYIEKHNIKEDIIIKTGEGYPEIKQKINSMEKATFPKFVEVYIA